MNEIFNPQRGSLSIFFQAIFFLPETCFNNIIVVFQLKASPDNSGVNVSF